MKLRYCAAIALLALCVFTSLAGDSYQFFYELRAPRTLKIDETTRFSVVTEQSAKSTRVRFTKHRDEAEFIVFTNSCLIFSDEKRRAVIIDALGQLSQVFRLTIPRKPSPSDWSKWARPDYLEKGNAIWTFMDDGKTSGSLTNVPPESFELRFKITPWSFP